MSISGQLSVVNLTVVADDGGVYFCVLRTAAGGGPELSLENLHRLWFEVLIATDLSPSKTEPTE